MSDRSKTDVRQAVLAAVRKNLAASARLETGKHVEPRPLAVVRRDDDPVERFRKSLHAVAGQSVLARDEREAAEAVTEILARAGARRVAVSDSPVVRVVAERLARDGVEIASAPDRATLFSCDAGVTGAQWGVAETGTLVLESGSERHRLASLVPPLHVAIVEADRIRHSLADVLGELGGKLSPTVTFVTGPSRTSDIELTLAIGVHGPAALHVVIVGGRADPEVRPSSR